MTDVPQRPQVHQYRIHDQTGAVFFSLMHLNMRFNRMAWREFPAESAQISDIQWSRESGNIDIYIEHPRSRFAHLLSHTSDGLQEIGTHPMYDVADFSSLDAAAPVVLSRSDLPQF